MRGLLLGSRVDRLLLFVALALVGVLWSSLSEQLAAGPAMVEIYRGDELLATYALPAPGEPAIHFDAEGELGVSRVSVDSSGARMEFSPCVTQHCVLSGTHKHAGDMIACVPNRILVLIRGGSRGGFDAIVE